ncbi:MAG: hypothetical protein PUC82_03915 [bacterium]|nr:hypothetical protein [bacterium]
MHENLKDYLTKIDNILNEKQIKNKEELLRDHLTQISFFQHERLIHLLVTIFVGIMAILFFIAGILNSSISCLILFACLLILFVPYIFHYFFLENGVQKLYQQYWHLKEK